MTTERSCDDCIFMLSAGPGPQEFGGPICGKGKGPLFLPSASDAQNNSIRAAKAASCDEYAENGPLLPDPQFTYADGAIVMLPDPKVVAQPILTAVPGIDKSCTMCRFYVPPETVAEQGLWPTGVCSARGIVISSRASNSIYGPAKDCDRFSFGTRDPQAVTRMQLSPEYTVSTIGRLSKVSDFARELKAAFVEPSTYPTDAPVTPEDEAAGVRAWRKIEHDNRHVLLPVFREDFFPENERAMIPRTGDDEHPEEYVDHLGLTYKAAVLWMELDETPALWGAAGTGKTEFYRHMAWVMQLPFHRISVTSSTEIDDLAGKMHYDPNRGTYFEYGRIPSAWQTPGVICLDEPNVGQPEVWQFIRPLTDNSKQLVLDMNKGERITRHNYAFMGMAMNPAWDIKNSGTDSLSDADGSRLMHIYVDLPDAAVERVIIANRVKVDGWEIEDDDLDMIMKVAEDLRAMADDGSLPVTWGIRPQIKVARALKWFSAPEAYRLASADYLEPEHQEMILTSVRSHMRARPRAQAGQGGSGTSQSNPFRRSGPDGSVLNAITTANRYA